MSAKWIRISNALKSRSDYIWFDTLKNAKRDREIDREAAEMIEQMYIALGELVRCKINKEELDADKRRQTPIIPVGERRQRGSEYEKSRVPAWKRAKEVIAWLTSSD